MRDSLDQRLSKWIIHCGFIPILVPNSLVSVDEDKQEYDIKLLKKWFNILNPDGFILSGGNDIGQFKDRDATEKYILDWAEARSKPVLGICRGMQMMADWAGVKLINKEGHVNTRHDINGVIKKEVNSYHDYALENCPEGFSILSKSSDGCIEAIAHDRYSWEGWMWHPEREEEFDNDDIQRFRRLFSLKP